MSASCHATDNACGRVNCFTQAIRCSRTTKAAAAAADDDYDENEDEDDASL